MYSVTFCVRVMLPERHHWKPTVQAAAVMLRTLPVDGQSPASQPRPLSIYGTKFWERPPSPASHRPAAPTDPAERSQCRHIAGWTQACNHGSRYVAIATQPVPRLQIRPIVHNQGAASTMPPSYIQFRAVVWAYGRGQTDTHTHRQTHRRAWSQYILRRLRLTQNVIKTM